MATIKKLYRWKTDPKGKAPAHTVTFKQHQVNRAPIVPGSSVNNKTLAANTKAAMDVKYGPLQAQQGRDIQRAQNSARDIGGQGGFYDQYLKQLAQHSAHINSIAGQANQAVGALPGQVTGLAQADLGSLQGQANAGAAARGMGPAGDLAPMASDATAVRQAMTGSFAAQQAAQNAAAQTYADSLAHVVGPTQKLAGQAVAQGKVKTARDKLADTKQQRGASALQYQTDTKASESKNVLAGQIAGIGAAAKAVATTETSRHNKAMEGNEAARIRAAAIKAGKLSPGEKKTNAELKFFNKHGYWPPTGPPKPAKPTTTKVPTLSAKDMGDAMTQLAQLKGLAAKAKAGEPFDPKHKKGGRGPLSRSDAAKKILGFATKIRDPLLATAALDVIYRGGSLHPNTVKRLRAAGYDPNRVIQTLGAKGVDAPAAMPKVVTAPSGHGNQKRPT